MKTKITLTLTGLLVSFLAPLAVLVPQASALVDSCTWTGGGSDNNFTTSANWSGCDNGPTLESGDSIIFDMSVLTTQSEILTNDIVGLSLAGINLTGAPSSFYNFKITGNPIILAGDITGDEVAGRLVFSVNVELGANITISTAEQTVQFGEHGISGLNLDLNTFDLTYDVPSLSCGGLSIHSSLVGSGNIISALGAGGIILSASTNTYTGSITSNGAGVGVNFGALSGSSTVTINGSGTVNLKSNENKTFPFDIVMNSNAEPAINVSYSSIFDCGGGPGDGIKYTTTLSGDLTLQANTVFEGTNDFVVAGIYTSNSNTLTTQQGSVGSITTSAGTIETEAVSTTIEATDKSTAFVSIGNKETVILNGERGNVTVGAGGTLKGTGKAGQIYVGDGGVLAPGLSPGCITATSGLYIEGTYQVEIAGTTACTAHDQTDVTGGVDVTGGTLNVAILNSFVPKLNDTFIIIKNDAADVVIGEFAGLVEGASIKVGDVTYQISYKGGDGNDVVLTATAVPATVTTPATGIGEIMQSPIMTLIAVMLSAGMLLGIKRIQSAK